MIRVSFNQEAIIPDIADATRKAAAVNDANHEFMQRSGLIQQQDTGMKPTNPTL